MSDLKLSTLGAAFLQALNQQANSCALWDSQGSLRLNANNLASVNLFAFPKLNKFFSGLRFVIFGHQHETSGTIVGAFYLNVHNIKILNS